MAPMTTNSAFENGMFTLDEHKYYERRAGGVGAIITSCAHIQENRKFAASPSVASDRHLESLAKLAQTIQAGGSKAILQIFHVGRMGLKKICGAKRLSVQVRFLLYVRMPKHQGPYLKKK